MTEPESEALPLTKNAERREKFRKIGQAISAIPTIWDRDWGGVYVHPWGSAMSDGYKTRQIITRRRRSKLEIRSIEYAIDDGSLPRD